MRPFHETITFGGMNLQQRHALRTEGFLLINAVAGSGKTTMLVGLLLKALMENQTLKLEHFAVITFTRKAGAQLRTRIRDAMEKEKAAAPESEENFWTNHLRDLPGAPIGTIDSLVQDRLRRLALNGVCSIDPAIEVLDSIGQEIIGRRAVELVLENAADNPTSDLGRAVLLLARNHPNKELGNRFMKLLNRNGDGANAAAAIRFFNNPHGGFENFEAILANPNRDKWLEFWTPLATGVADRLATAVTELGNETTTEAGEVRNLQAIWPQEKQNNPELFQRLRDCLFTQSGTIRSRGLSSRGRPYSNTLNELQNDLLPAVEPFDGMVYQTDATPFAETNNCILYLAWATFFEAAHAQYHDECRRENRFSFHDLATLFEQELSSRAPDEIAKAGLPFHRVMIDEFQDNTSLQWSTGCRISGGNPDDPRTWANITVVGDPEQAIYHWRGSNAQLMPDVRERYVSSHPHASPTWYDSIRHLYPEMNTASSAHEKIGIGQLNLNFRTKAETLARIDACSAAAMASRGIPHVQLVSGEHLRPADKANTTPAIAEMLRLPELPATATGHNIVDQDDGAEHYDGTTLTALASRLKILHDEQGVPWNEMLILARSYNKLIQPLHEAFQQAGIPYRAMVREAVWQRQEVRDVVSLATCLADADHGPALLAVLRGPVFRLTDGEILLVSSWNECRSLGQNLYQVAQGNNPTFPAAAEAWQHLSEDRKACVRSAAIHLHNWRQLVDRMPHHELIQNALETSGAFEAMAAWLTPLGTGAESVRRSAAGIDFVINRMREIESARPITLVNLVELLGLYASGGIKEDIDPDLSIEEDMVRVMTIHASKGLEAKAVALVIPEVSRSYTPPASDMIIVDRQYLRPDVDMAVAAPYLGMPLMNLSGTFDDSDTVIPSLFKIAQTTDCVYSRQEEARLFHVAITRSEGTLLLAAPRKIKEDDCRHWPVVWSEMHLDHIDASTLPILRCGETIDPIPAPLPGIPKASPARVAIAATRLQGIMELKDRKDQVESLAIVRRGLQAFPAGVPKNLLPETTRSGESQELGKVVGTLAHRGFELGDAMPADGESRLDYLRRQARLLLSARDADDEPTDSPREDKELENAVASANTIINRMELPTHDGIRTLLAQPGAAEVDFALPIGSRWIITGRFDRLLDQGDVIDWKTDRATPDEIVARYTTQMQIYALAVAKSGMAANADQPIVVHLAMLHGGNVVPLSFDAHALAAAEAKLVDFLNID